MSLLDQEMRLFRMLREKSEESQLKWKAGVLEDSYRVDFAKSSVEISLAERGGATDVVMSIRDGEGNLVQSISDVDFASASGEEPGNWYGAMMGLYDLARKSALGTDKIISSILNELENGDF